MSNEGMVQVWVPAPKFKIGDKVLNINGWPRTVTNVKWGPSMRRRGKEVGHWGWILETIDPTSPGAKVIEGFERHYEPDVDIQEEES